MEYFESVLSMIFCAFWWGTVSSARISACRDYNELD
jgi:hypothetical protein